MNAFSNLFILLIILIGSQPSFAGDKRGGGDVFICKISYTGQANHERNEIQRSGSQLEEVHLADTFSISHDYYSFLSLVKKLGIKDLELDYRNYLLNSSYPIDHEKNLELRQRIRDTIATQNLDLAYTYFISSEVLQFMPVEDLPELDDDNLQVPDGCQKKQLAIQDIETGEVKYVKRLFDRLNIFEQVMFMFHEVAIRQNKEIDLAIMDTSAVREEIKNLASDALKFHELFGLINTVNFNPSGGFVNVSDGSGDNLPFLLPPMPSDIFKVHDYSTQYFIETKSGRKILERGGSSLKQAFKSQAPRPYNDKRLNKQMVIFFTEWFVLKTQVKIPFMGPGGQWTKDEMNRINSLLESDR